MPLAPALLLALPLLVLVAVLARGMGLPDGHLFPPPATRPAILSATRLTGSLLSFVGCLVVVCSYRRDRKLLFGVAAGTHPSSMEHPHSIPSTAPTHPQGTAREHTLLQISILRARRANLTGRSVLIQN